MILKHSGRKGFSLIELLIVVAIIAILTAIAVPNYQEALSRSKVARFKGDAKAVEVGVESYYSEWSVYPPADRYSVLSDCGSWNSQSTNPNEGYLTRRLTTPQSYLSKLPIDIWKNFGDRGQCYPVRTTYIYSNDNFNYIWYNYFYVSNCYALLKGQMATNNARPTQAVWMISSPAADGVQNHGRSTASQNSVGEANSGLPVQYDPTNGSNTTGDLFFFGPGLGFGLAQ